MPSSNENSCDWNDSEPGFDGLHRSWQCQYCLVIADICDQNCMWSLFEHTHLLCLGGIGGRTEKNVQNLSSLSFVAVLNKSVGRAAVRCHSGCVAGWQSLAEPWELHQGPVCILPGTFMDILP